MKLEDINLEDIHEYDYARSTHHCGMLDGTATIVLWCEYGGYELMSTLDYDATSCVMRFLARQFNILNRLTR